MIIARSQLKIKICLSCMLILLLLFSDSGRDVLGSDPPQGQDVIRLNNILINKVKKEIRINAKLALREGILEYFLVSEPGKTYESVFKIIENKPSELNFAMLLLGFNPLNFEDFIKLTNDKNGLTELLKNHEDSLVELELLRDGKRVGWTSLMKDRQGSNNPLIWVYTGGVFIKDKMYAGDMELSHIGIWPDMSAVINLYSNMGNPYRGGFGLEMNKDNAGLKVDQDFEIVIRRKKQ